MLVFNGILYYNKYGNKNLTLSIREDKIMAFVVGDACVGCGACAGSCPVGAISMDTGVAVIDPDTCISCGSCAGQCPVGTISEE